MQVSAVVFVAAQLMDAATKFETAVGNAVGITSNNGAEISSIGKIAGKVTIAEVEHLFEPGQINPDHIVTPGVFVQRMIHVPNAVKHIEQRTVRKRVAAAT